MSVSLPQLPWKKDALEPHISARTLDFHYGKHHNAYVTNLNKLIEGTPLANEPLEEIIRSTEGRFEQAGIFNNAAQVWNHSFYWNCIKPGGGGAPTGEIASLITRDFGSYDEFKNKFKQAAATQFGSGWAWLVFDGSKLNVMKTSNAVTPIGKGIQTLLTIDVWEHAYYLDFQNRHPDYIDTFINHLINWDFVNKNL